MISCVYEILNIVNGKPYVGSTTQGFNIRWKDHRNDLKAGRHSNPHLQASYNKYGPEAFEFFVIEYCEPEECLKKEQFWMDALKVVKKGYNICPVAGNTLGRKCSDETKKKISVANFGNKHTDEARKKMSGKELSEEHKNKISKALSGENSPHSRMVTFEGRTQNITAWSKELNIPYNTLWNRLNNPNWSIEKALTTPVRGSYPGIVG